MCIFYQKKLSTLNSFFNRSIFLLVAIQLCLLFKPELKAQSNVSKPNPIMNGFGYSDKGDSVEFIFGQQKKIIVGGLK